MLDELIKSYLATGADVEKLDRELKELKRKQDAIEQKIIDEMDSNQITSCKTEEGTFSILSSLFASVNKPDIEKAKVWFDECGILPELITEEIRKGRLNDVVRKMLEENKIVPEFIKYYIRRKISQRN